VQRVYDLFCKALGLKTTRIINWTIHASFIFQPSCHFKLWNKVSLNNIFFNNSESFQIPNYTMYMVCLVFFLRENTTVKNRCKNSILRLLATVLFELFLLLSCSLQLLFLPLRLCTLTLHGLLADCVTWKKGRENKHCRHHPLCEQLSLSDYKSL